MQSLVKTLLMVCAMLLCLSACSDKEGEKKEKKSPNAVAVSVVTAQSEKLEIVEESIGTLEGIIDPTVAAEVAGRVIKVYAKPGQTVKKGEWVAQLDAIDYSLQKNEAQAEVARIEALLANQTKMVERNQKLVNKNFISQNALDDTTAQQAALKEQLSGAKARIASISHTGSKTRITAPADGIVEKLIVAEGDFVKVGDPILQVISKQRLRAHLPFPESIASKIKPGLTVHLSTPTSSQTVIATVRDLKPMVNNNSRAVDITADIVDQPDWQPGASVNASIVLGAHEAAIVVPEQSVVLRPAGEVVYAIENNIAVQKIVKTGLRFNNKSATNKAGQGKVEILEGVSAGETIVMDGAGFLSDGAKVQLQTKARANTKTNTNKSSAEK